MGRWCCDARSCTKFDGVLAPVLKATRPYFHTTTTVLSSTIPNAGTALEITADKDNSKMAVLAFEHSLAPKK